MMFNLLFLLLLVGWSVSVEENEGCDPQENEDRVFEQEKVEQENREQERREKERKEQEKIEKERIDQQKREQEKKEKEEREQEKREQEKREREKEKSEKERRQQEKIEKEQEKQKRETKQQQQEKQNEKQKQKEKPKEKKEKQKKTKEEEDLLDSLKKQYENHLNSSYNHTLSFYTEILGENVAHQNALDLGDLGHFQIQHLCGIVTVFLLQVFFVCVVSKVLWSVIQSRQLKPALFFFFLGAIGLFVCSTHQTRNQLASSTFGVEIDSEWIPVVVDEDPVPFESLRKIFFSFLEAIHGTWEAGKLWAIAVLLVLGPLIHLLIFLLISSLPYIAKAVQLFFEQDKTNIYLEVGTVVFFFFSWALKRHIQRARYWDRFNRWCSEKYRAMIKEVQKKSLAVASILPHLLVVIPVVLFIYFLPEIASSISGGWMVVLLALLYPLIRSVKAIESLNEDGMGQGLMYWVILAVPVSLHLIIDILPLVGRALDMIPYQEEVSFLFLLWLLLPVTNGVSVVYRLIVSFLDRYVAVKPPTIVSEEQKGFFMKLLPSLFSGRAGKFIVGLLESGVLMIGLIFFLTPGFVTALGVVFVSLATPVYYSIKSINKSRGNKRQPQKRRPVGAGLEGEGAEEAPDLRIEIRSRLIYWVIAMPCTFLFILCETVGLSDIPGWYHIKLGFFFYLQFPMIGGSDSLYQRFHAILKKFGLFSTPPSMLGVVKQEEPQRKIEERGDRPSRREREERKSEASVVPSRSLLEEPSRPSLVAGPSRSSSFNEEKSVDEEPKKDK